MKVATLFAVVSLGFASVGSAATSAIDQQVDSFFNKGLQHCKNAMELSRTSGEVAAAEYDRYESYISKVEALKPELKDDVMVKRQMEQCEQVGHDIARTEALPVIEEGLAACKEVKDLIAGDYITKAKAKFLQYTQHRDEALSMTDTVLKVSANASKVRRCDRLEEKIIAAEQRIHHSEIKADRLLSALRKSNDSCDVTQAMAGDIGTSEEKLAAAETMLSQARDYFKSTEQYGDALARAENFPGYESSKQIRQELLAYSRCEQSVVAQLNQQRQVIAQQRATQPAPTQQEVASQEAETVPQTGNVQVVASETELSQAEQPASQPVYAPELVQMAYELE